QDLALERNGRQDDVEGAEPVGRDDDTPPVGKIVILANLALVAVRQFRNMGVGESAQIAHRHGLRVGVHFAFPLTARNRMGSRRKDRAPTYRTATADLSWTIVP